MTREQVRLAQKELNRLGIRGADGRPLLEDGIIGPQTRHALAQRAAQMQAQPAQGVPLPRPKPGDLNARPGMAIPRDHPNRPSLRRDIDDFVGRQSAITPNRQMGAMQLPAMPTPPMPAMRDPDSRMSIHDPGHRYSEAMNLRDAARSPQSPRGIAMAAAREAAADRWRQGKWQSRYGSQTSPQLEAMGAVPNMGRFGDAFQPAGQPPLAIAEAAARQRLIPLMPPATSDWDRPVQNAMVAEPHTPMPNGFAGILGLLDPIRGLLRVPTMSGGAPAQAAPIPQRQERPRRPSLADQQAAEAEKTRLIREDRERRSREHQARMQQLRAGR